MAHFALLNEDNIVIQVVVISDDSCLDENGEESEEVGKEFCKTLFNTGPWIQTSYNGRIRRRHAGIGLIYLPESDVFIHPQPRPWYVLNSNYDWECPIGIHPETGEELQDWQWEYLEIMDTVNLRPDYGIQLSKERGLPL